MLADARGGDEDAWSRAWSLALRTDRQDVANELLAMVDDPRQRLRRIAPTVRAYLRECTDESLGLQRRGRAGRRAAALLERVGAEHAPYVCRTRQWGDERLVHLGLCGAPRHMTLSPSSARWDLVRGGLCKNCLRAL